MTIRTTQRFGCSNGHQGVECTSENDQPYSASWERVRLEGMARSGVDAAGAPIYRCAVCGEPMTPTGPSA